MARDYRRILTEGLYAGVLGYGVVAVVIAALDVASGRSPFHTVALPGSVLFFGLRDASELVIRPGPVLAFNGVHMLLFPLFGAFMAWLASLAEKGEQMWYLSLGLFLFVLPHVLGLPIWFRATVRQSVPLWSVALATAVSSIVMAGYLLHAHPRLRDQITESTA